jgi:hypothetical protein
MHLSKDTLKRSRDGVNMGFEIKKTSAMGLSDARGEVFIKVEDGKTGEVLHDLHLKNVITSDASILAATLFRDPTSRLNGFNMLSVGTGATGSLLSPDAPDPAQRKLNSEIARKAWSTTVFRDAGGNAVAIPTNIVDFTCTFDEGEAVGPLNEMGIQSTISNNPLVLNPNPNVYPTRDVTVDLSLYDILGNYLTFSVISIPATARFTVTWRITF